MDITSTTANPAVPVKPATTSDTPYSKAKDRFAELAAIVIDSSGKFSDSERAEAYSSIHQMIVTDQLNGIDDDGNKLHIAVTKSDFALRASAMGEQQVQIMNALIQSGRGDEVAEACLKYFDGLSNNEQEVYFKTQLNPYDFFLGGKRFSNAEDYRASLGAKSKLDKYISSAKADGKTPESDPTYAQALKLASGNQKAESWASQVLKLFSVKEDKVTLSPEAKRILGDDAGTNSPSQKAKPYEPGSVASKLA